MQDRVALRTTPHARHLYRRAVARRRALSFFKCDLSALEKTPERRDASRYSTTLQQFLQLGERDIRLRCHRVQNQLRMGFDTLRFAVTALALRNDVANFLEATAPADRAGRADTKALGSPSTGQAAVNRGYHRRSTESALVIHADLLRQHVA